MSLDREVAMSLISLRFDEAEPAVREGAGFWIRALARVIDTLVHYGVAAAVAVVVAIMMAIGSAMRGVPPDEGLARLSATTGTGILAALLGGIALHTLAEGIHGSTVGKRICGLTVISEDGTPATLVGALKRSVAYFGDALFFGLIAAKKMSESPRRQRFGDVWGRTQVVRLSSLEPHPRRSWPMFAGAVVAGITVDGMILFLEVAYRFL